MEDLSSSQWTLIRALPVPLWLVILQPGGTFDQLPFDEVRFLMQLKPQPDPPLVLCSFRAVGIDRLAIVLAKGVDVEPTNATIFVDFFSKAWEYGGWPKVVLAFDPSRLDRTWREVP